MAANVDGKPSTEESPISSWNPRVGLEAAVRGFTDRGVKTSIVRLAQIHDTHKQGLVPLMLAVTRQKGVSAYIGDGSNRWPAAHVTDTARLYRMAFDKAEAGAIYHAVDEEGSDNESDCGSTCAWAERSSGQPEAGGGGSTLRLACALCDAGYAIVQHDDATEAELEANWAGADRGPGRQ